SELGKARAISGIKDAALLDIFEYLYNFLLDNTEKHAVKAVLALFHGYEKIYITNYNYAEEHKLLSDQEQLRQALSSAFNRQKQELLVKNHAIETSLNGILIADLNLNISYTNPALLSMLGENGTLITKSTFISIVGEPSIRNLQKQLKETGAWQEEINYRQDTKSVDLFLSASLIRDNDSRPIGIMVSFVDITSSKKLEAQFRQSQKMEALGKLAGGIAHDFNNILAAISGYAELQLLDFPEESQQYRDMLQIKQAAERGKGLTNQLLFFTRRASKERNPLNVNKIVKETIQLLKRTFPPEIKIRMVLDKDLKLINGNQSQINQVLMNLCVNARDAMLDSDDDRSYMLSLEISTYNSSIDKATAAQYVNASAGEYVCLKVSDTGRGMPPEIVEHLFEPFFTTKAAGKGTGLGLSVVYGIVRGHNGFIDVNSRPNEGTSFSLYLPALQSGTSAELADKNEDTLVTGSGTILIVEDEPQVRYMEARTLEKCGYSVLIVKNGREAIEFYSTKQEEIDLVILDMVMPEMGGRECFYRLKKINQDIKIILITGYTTDPSLTMEIKEKAAGSIEKPFKLHEFTRKVHEALISPIL
ncbi:MAG: response regulator, partial [Spirochaetes bacterium]|nr:response regulator [Spirochaetota bacterium]